MMTGRRANGNRRGTRTSSEGKNLSSILRRSKKVGTFYSNQCQVAANADRGCSTLPRYVVPRRHSSMCTTTCATNHIIRTNDRTTQVRSKGIAHTYRNVTMCYGNERSGMQYLCSE